MSAIIDLEELPVTNSIDFLRERMLIAPVPLILEPHPGTEVVAHSRVADLGGIHLLCTKAQGGDVVRTPRLARDGTPPSLMVSVVDHGTAVIDRGDTTTVLHEGDIGLYATTEPYRLRFTPGTSRLTYQFRLDELALSEDLIRGQLAEAIRPDTVTAAAVSAFLRSTARHAPRSTPEELTALSGPVIDLIRLLLTRVAADEPAGREASTQSLATRIEEFVKAHLGDPDLSAQSLAWIFSISERYVYTILARRGMDLGDLIRQHRLDRAVRMLEDPSNAATSIATIAHQCGYTDHPHFSRAFRARFECSPTEWRMRASH